MRTAWPFVVALSILQCCEYIPETDNFQEKSIPDPSGINLTEISEDDTLLILVPTLVSSSIVNTANRRIYRAEMTIDGDIVHGQSYDHTISYIVNPYYYETGVHEIKIEFYISTGSNSLADKLEVEKLFFSKTWKFETDNSDPTKPTITNIAFDNGALRISWTPYDKKNFGKYELRNDCCGIIKTIADIKTASALDTTYIGGERYYYVYAYNNRDQYSYSGSTIFRDDSAIKLRAFKKNGKDFDVSWSKTRYTKAFQSYMVTEEEGYSGYKLIETKTGLNDTTAVLSAKGIQLGGSKEIRISTIANGFHSYYFNKYPRIAVRVYQGTRHQPHVIKGYARGNKSVYSHYNGKLFRLDDEDLDTLSSLVADYAQPFVVSPNGQHAYLGSGGNILKVNPETFETIETILASSLLGGNYYQLQQVTDNNFLVGYGGNKPTVVDMNTKQIIHQNPTDADINLSEDGRLMYCARRIYGLSNGSYTELVNLTGVYAHVYFNPNYPDEAIVLYNYDDKIKIINPWTNVLRTEFAIPSEYKMTIDPTTNIALMGDRIFDLTAQKQIMNLGETYGNPFYFFNNHLYRYGSYIKLDDYQP